MQIVGKISSVKLFGKLRIYKKPVVFKRHAFSKSLSPEGKTSIIRKTSRIYKTDPKGLEKIVNVHNRRISNNQSNLRSENKANSSSSSVGKSGNFKPKQVLVVHIPPNSQIEKKIIQSGEGPSPHTVAALVSVSADSVNENGFSGDVDVTKMSTVEFDKVDSKKIMLVPIVLYENAHLSTSEKPATSSKEDVVKRIPMKSSIISQSIQREVENSQEVFSFQLPSDLGKDVEKVPISSLKLDLQMQVPNVEKIVEDYVENREREEGLDSSGTANTNYSKAAMNLISDFKIEGGEQDKNSDKSAANGIIPLDFKAEINGVLGLNLAKIDSKNLEELRNVDFNSLITAVTGNIASVAIQKSYKQSTRQWKDRQYSTSSNDTPSNLFQTYKSKINKNSSKSKDHKGGDETKNKGVEGEFIPLAVSANNERKTGKEISTTTGTIQSTTNRSSEAPAQDFVSTNVTKKMIEDSKPNKRNSIMSSLKEDEVLVQLSQSTNKNTPDKMSTSRDPSLKSERGAQSAKSDFIALSLDSKNKGSIPPKESAEKHDDFNKSVSNFLSSVFHSSSISSKDGKRQNTELPDKQEGDEIKKNIKDSSISSTMLTSACLGPKGKGSSKGTGGKSDCSASKGNDAGQTGCSGSKGGDKKGDGKSKPGCGTPSKGKESTTKKTESTTDCSAFGKEMQKMSQATCTPPDGGSCDEVKIKLTCSAFTSSKGPDDCTVLLKKKDKDKSGSKSGSSSPCGKKDDKKDSCAKKDNKKVDCSALSAKKSDPCMKRDDKKDPCAKKDDPCAKKPDPCAKKPDPSAKKPDPCAKKSDPCAKKSDPCAKKSDPCAKKQDPCAKKPDPCAKKPDPCAKKPDPCAKKPDPSAKKPDPCAKKPDPCAKKEDPCAKKPDPCAKKPDPCAKKPDPCAKKEDKKDICAKKDDKKAACSTLSGKKSDTGAKKGDVKVDCSALFAKKSDTGAKKVDCSALSAKKSDPCMKKDDKKDPCAKKDDPCAKKPDPCAKKEDPCAKKADPCAKKSDPCAKKPDPCAKKPDPCAKKPDPCAKKPDPCAKKPDPCAKKEDPCAKKPDPCAKKDDKKADCSSGKDKKKLDCSAILGKKDNNKPLSKIDCSSLGGKKSDPNAKRPDPCSKKADPCAKKPDPCAKKEDPCAKKPDPCAKKDDKKADCSSGKDKKKLDCSAILGKKDNNKPLSKIDCSSLGGKKSDPCAKKSDPNAKKPDPCAKKPDPCAKKPDPCAKKEDPCAKKSDPCAKKSDPCANKPDPCAKKEDPCAKKADPCAKKSDPCAKKPDPCSKKPDPCSKKPDPCGKKDDKKVDCSSSSGKKVDKKGSGMNCATLAITAKGDGNLSSSKVNASQKDNSVTTGKGDGKKDDDYSLQTIKITLAQGIQIEITSAHINKDDVHAIQDLLNLKPNTSKGGKSGALNSITFPAAKEVKSQTPTEINIGPITIAFDEDEFASPDEKKLKGNKSDEKTSPFKGGGSKPYCTYAREMPPLLNNSSKKRFNMIAPGVIRAIPSKGGIAGDLNNAAEIPLHAAVGPCPSLNPGQCRSPDPLIINKVVKVIDCREVCVESVPVPPIGDYDVLLRVDSVGLTGSDLYMYETGAKSNNVVTLGHEASGVVEKVGKCVTNVKVGDNITVEPGVPCGTCDNCRRGCYNICNDTIFNGSLAKYCIHPSDFCHKLPKNCDLDNGALVHPLALALYACNRAKISVKSNVLIIGACPLGLSSVICAKAMGARNVTIVDVMEKNMDVADKLGADITLLVNDKMSNREIIECILANMCRVGEPNVVINCSGCTKSLNTAIMCLTPGGVCVLTGCQSECANFSIIDALMKEITMVSSFRSCNMFPHAISLLESCRADVSQMITHRFCLPDVKEAFETALNDQCTGAVKVIVKCQDREDEEEERCR